MTDVFYAIVHRKEDKIPRIRQAHTSPTAGVFVDEHEAWDFLIKSKNTEIYKVVPVKVTGV